VVRKSDSTKNFPVLKNHRPHINFHYAVSLRITPKARGGALRTTATGAGGEGAGGRYAAGVSGSRRGGESGRGETAVGGGETGSGAGDEVGWGSTLEDCGGKPEDGDEGGGEETGTDGGTFESSESWAVDGGGDGLLVLQVQGARVRLKSVSFIFSLFYFLTNSFLVQTRRAPFVREGNGGAG
jgi:hypothetical protein